MFKNVTLETFMNIYMLEIFTDHRTIDLVG